MALAATSNTLPDRLGEERFAADDFPREIQGLAARFTAVRVDGPYGALVDDVTTVHFIGVRAAPDQNTALRLVVLADRLYDRQIPVVVSGVLLDRLFDGDMLAGGYRRKYRRAISRLVALNRLGVGVG